MRSRSFTVVELTAALSPIPWGTVAPGSQRTPWLLVFTVAAVGILGLSAAAASALHGRRLRREQRWTAASAQVETVEATHFLSDLPDGLVPGFEVDLEVVPDPRPASRTWVSPATELRVPTSVRALACPDVPPDTLIDGMSACLPERGLAAAKTGERFHLARPTWRLIDRRILTAAAELLDADVAEPLVAGLARLAQIRDAAQRTLDDAELPEVIETLMPPGPFTVSHGLTVAIEVEQNTVATFRFRLDVTATLGETALLVRRAEVVEVACQELILAATLVLVGRGQPLWQAEAFRAPEVHMAPDPPVLVPLTSASAPEPRDADDPAEKTIEMPPLPLVGLRPEGAPADRAKAG